MQLRKGSAFLLFVGSYLPLAAILALQDIPASMWSRKFCRSVSNCDMELFANPMLSIGAVAVTLVCFLMTIFVLENIRYKYPIEVIESKAASSELISYSFPYIVSFMGVDYSSSGKIAGLVIFLFWLFIITYRAGQIIMNPLLLIFGWNLYEAKIKINSHIRTTRILSKGELRPAKYHCQAIQGNYICEEGAGE